MFNEQGVEACYAAIRKDYHTLLQEKAARLEYIDSRAYTLGPHYDPVKTSKLIDTLSRELTTMNDYLHKTDWLLKHTADELKAQITSLQIDLDLCQNSAKTDLETIEFGYQQNRRIAAERDTIKEENQSLKQKLQQYEQTGSPDPQ